MIRKKPGGRTHVDDATLTGELLVEPWGGGKETIPVTKLRTKTAATATPPMTNLLERDIEGVAFRNYRFEPDRVRTRLSPEDRLTDCFRPRVRLTIEVPSDP